MLKGICDICGKPGNLHSCSRCGRRVCTEHYDAESGLCSICRQPLPKPLAPGQLVVPEKPTSVSPGDVRK